MSFDFHITDDIDRRPYDRFMMARLLRYIRPHRSLLIVATLLLLLAALFSNITPLFIMRAIDEAIGIPRNAELVKGSADSYAAAPKDEIKATLLRMVSIIALLMLGEALARSVQAVIVAYVGQRAMMAMRVQLFAHLQRMSIRFLDRNPVGRLMTRVTNDVEKLQETIVSGLVQVVSDLFTIVVIVGFMLWVNWRLTLITLLTAPLIGVTSVIFGKFARTSYVEIRKRIAAVNTQMQETISGMRIVQLFGQEQRSFEQFSVLNAAHRDEWLRQVQNYAIYFPVVDTLAALTTALIILYGGHQILSGHATALGAASIGMFFAYVQWGERLFGPVRSIADRYNLLLEAMASAERIFGLLDTDEDVRDAPTALSADNVRGRVEFENVSFEYEAGQSVLKHINLAIEPGERIAIVGHTGAGKTTLVSLLCRFYDVTDGRILIDGIDVREYRQDALRMRIGMVLQDVFLFSGSIDSNIRLGNPLLEDATVRACATHVNAAHFIEKLNGGYDYDVGERGGNLSTGQRQLLAFARTLAHDPRILVLDEATSSVDTESEAWIQDAIEKLMTDRTSIVIAHRLSTIQHADRIIVMHHGEIREMGAHQELLAKRGIYYTLYELQYKDQAGAA